MPPVATRIRSLADVLVGHGEQQSQDLPLDALAGFDAVAQFSHSLLNRQVIRSLVQHSLASLSAYAAWGAVPLPASLLAVIPPRLRILLTVRDARVEVRLVQPYLAALIWPDDIGPGGGPGSEPRGVPQHRAADVGWRVEVNLLTPRLVSGFPQDSSGGSLRLSAPGSRRRTFPDRPDVPVSNVPSSVEEGSWDRLTLVAGQTITGAKAEAVVHSSLWRFGMELDFSDTRARTPASDQDASLIEFLETDGGKSLLTRSLVSLKAAAGVRLTPEVAPAGPLAAAIIQPMNLPAITVRDRLLTGDRGESILSLCVELGGSAGGVVRQVPRFLSSGDFGYAASATLLGHAYKACWKVAAPGMTFVGETTVELPLADDPTTTLPGRAQLMISFSDVLDDVSIRTFPNGLGDAIRLLSKQRIQLLNLWDNAGNRFTELGELGEPQDESLLLPINLFETAVGEPGQLHPNFQDFLIKLIRILVLPLSEPFSIRASSISGFCSSATQTNVLRWNHTTVADEVHAPVPESSEV
jgi:hypothetical protein